jgi:hypothetical protein
MLLLHLGNEKIRDNNDDPGLPTPGALPERAILSSRFVKLADAMSKRLTITMDDRCDALDFHATLVPRALILTQMLRLVCRPSRAGSNLSLV